MRRHKLDKKEVQNCKKLFSFFSKRKKEEGEIKETKNNSTISNYQKNLHSQLAFVK